MNKYNGHRRERRLDRADRAITLTVWIILGLAAVGLVVHTVMWYL